jgi:hypothetical protein
MAPHQSPATQRLGVINAVPMVVTGAFSARQTLQPEATGTTMQVTK